MDVIPRFIFSLLLSLTNLRLAHITLFSPANPELSHTANPYGIPSDGGPVRTRPKLYSSKSPAFFRLYVSIGNASACYPSC